MFRHLAPTRDPRLQIPRAIRRPRGPLGEKHLHLRAIAGHMRHQIEIIARLVILQPRNVGIRQAGNHDARRCGARRGHDHRKRTFGGRMYPVVGQRIGADVQFRRRARNPLRMIPRAGGDNHITAAILSLLQNEFMTGQILTVDGGESLTNVGQNAAQFDQEKI